MSAFLISNRSENSRPRLGMPMIFTLIELLVVIAIIAVLASILLPALGKARDKSMEIVCANKMKQLYYAASLYSSDNDGYLPGRRDYGQFNQLVPDYIDAGSRLHGTKRVWSDLSGPLTCPRTRQGNAPCFTGTWPPWNAGDEPRYTSSYSPTAAVYYWPEEQPPSIRPSGGWSKCIYYGSGWDKCLEDEDAKRLFNVTPNSIIVIEKGYYKVNWFCPWIKDITLLENAINGDLTSGNNPAWWHHNNSANFLFNDGHVDNFKYLLAPFEGPMNSSHDTDEMRKAWTVR